VVAGWVGQTANLQEWRNSAGSVDAFVTPARKIVAPSLLVGGTTALGFQTVEFQRVQGCQIEAIGRVIGGGGSTLGLASNVFSIYNATAASRQALFSQGASGNLTDAGVLTNVFYEIYNFPLDAAAMFVSGVANKLALGLGYSWTDGAQVQAITSAADVVPIAAIGFDSQTANLFEALKSNGGQLFTLTAAGDAEFRRLSSTTEGRQAGDITTTWADSTDASRKARVIHNVYDTAAREALRLEASGSAAMLGFLGASASARTAVTGDIFGSTALGNLLTELDAKGLLTDSTTDSGAPGGAAALDDLTDVNLPAASQGDILYRNATEWVRLVAGTSGDVLKTQGAAANPIWDTLAPPTSLAQAVIIDPASGTRNVIQPTADVLSLAIKSPGPTANLQEWQTALGATLSRVTVDGAFLIALAADTIPLTIKAASSQSVSLQEWQSNGGTVLAKIDPLGMTVNGTFSQTYSDAVTVSDSTGFLFNHQTSGTPAAGYGTSYFYQLQSSTNPSRSTAKMTTIWTDATDATRKARLSFSVYDTSVRLALQMEASGTAAMIGFLGASPVVRPTSTTDLRTALINLGLYTTGGASPLNLNGGALTASGTNSLGATTFTGNVTLSTKNLVTDTTTGSQIGTGATQKLGFYGATPVVQPTSTTDLRTALINLGLYATGGASPLDLNGGNLTLNAASIITDTTTGLKIATGATQKVGFFNAAPVVQPSAYTQTYATADKTHAARTAAAMTDNIAGTVSTTPGAIPACAGANLAALITDLNNNVIPALRNALSSLIDQTNKGRVDALDTSSLANSVIDDLQSLGLAA
jgi:hypothetical protein